MSAPNSPMNSPRLKTPPGSPMSPKSPLGSNRQPANQVDFDVSPLKNPSAEEIRRLLEAFEEARQEFPEGADNVFGELEQHLKVLQQAVHAAEPKADPEEPEVDPEEKPEEPEEPKQPEVDPVEPDEPKQPEVDPVEPDEPKQPEEKPEELEDPKQPEEKPEELEDPKQPEEKPEEPDEPKQPEVDPVEPEVDPVKPEQPEVDPKEPSKPVPPPTWELPYSRCDLRDAAARLATPLDITTCRQSSNATFDGSEAVRCFNAGLFGVILTCVVLL